MNSDLRLVDPSIEYKEGFINYVVDYKENGTEFYYEMYKPAMENFELYIKELNNYSKGINIPENFVPYSTFW